MNSGFLCEEARGMSRDEARKQYITQVEKVEARRG